MPVRLIRHVGRLERADEIAGSYYMTADGRFRVCRIWVRGGRTWQAEAMDGTEPFSYFIGRREYRSRFYNADTLADVRDEISLISETDGD